MAEIKRARIQDVAEKAGVSMMTVSRVLNQDTKVSDKTREKVMAVVEQLHYRPNVSARRLASTKSFFLGLIYDNPSDSYISQFLLAALKKCRSIGYHLVVDEAHGDIEQTIESVKQLIEVTQVDGMILLPPLCNNEIVLEVLKQANVPFVRITPDSKLNMAPYICMDDYQAAFDVTERLINQGHRKIAHGESKAHSGALRLLYASTLFRKSTGG